VLLSATLIVRDEAAVLGACLRSLAGVVDETVVVDTGSTDGTPALAAARGARVTARPWRGDFAAARNEALALARGRWVLYIDADERVAPCDPAALRRQLADPGAVAATVRFRPQAGFTRYREYRLFRNDPRIRFRGAIHETMLPGIEAVRAADGLRVVAADVAVDHVGYDADQRPKHLRNLPLLRARLAEEPGHVFCWHHLGEVLAALGDEAGALAAWRRGVDLVRARPTPAWQDSLPYVDLLNWHAGRGEDGGPLLDEALGRFPGHHALAWLHARRLVRAGRPAEAIPVLEGLAAVDAETYCDPRLAYDARLFGLFAYEGLGLCHFRCGAFAESAAWYARAEAVAADPLPSRTRRRLAEARAAASGGGPRRGAVTARPGAGARGSPPGPGARRRGSRAP
jgi:hypothetical protein